MNIINNRITHHSLHNEVGKEHKSWRIKNIEINNQG